MNKLYNKSELGFSIFFIVLYIIGASLCDIFSDKIGLSKVFTFPFLFILSAILLFWIINNQLLKKYGLCKPNYNSKYFLYYIPLLILISTNLWFGVKANFNLIESVLNVLTMICVGFVEELIFRGFLFRALEKNNVKSAIIISSVTFGIGHLVNLFSNGFENIIPNICQVFYAMAVGFLFVVILYKGGSLLACILAHSTINALSIFQNTEFYNNTTEIIVSLIIIFIAVSYSMFLLKSPTKNKIDNTNNGEK